MKAPAIVLVNPKFPHNLAAAIRAASCFGLDSLIWTGSRIDFAEGERLPREERMKGYAHVEFVNDDRPFDLVDGTPVCVELQVGSTPLDLFEHPRDAVYVFGPEDGNVPQVYRRFCHRFVYIPADHCLNLAAALNVVLYDRRAKRQALGLERLSTIQEILDRDRGPVSAVGWEGK